MTRRCAQSERFLCVVTRQNDKASTLGLRHLLLRRHNQGVTALRTTFRKISFEQISLSSINLLFTKKLRIKNKNHAITRKRSKTQDEKEINHKILINKKNTKKNRDLLHVAKFLHAIIAKVNHKHKTIFSGGQATRPLQTVIRTVHIK